MNFITGTVNYVLGEATMAFQFFIVVVIFSAIWALAGWIERRKWHWLFKLPLCVIFLVSIQFIANAWLYVSVQSDETFWFWGFKPLVEGMLVPIIFVKMIPTQGIKIALWVVIAYTGIQSYMVYAYFAYETVVTNYELYIALISSFGAVATWLVLFKGGISVNQPIDD